MRTKYNAYIPGMDPEEYGMEINVSNQPVVEFEELNVILPGGGIAHVAGAYSWNRLKTRTNCSKLFGQQFNMESDDWFVEGCYILEDKKTIYFRNAKLLDDRDHLDGE